MTVTRHAVSDEEDDVLPYSADSAVASIVDPPLAVVHTATAVSDRSPHSFPRRPLSPLLPHAASITIASLGY